MNRYSDFSRLLALLLLTLAMCLLLHQLPDKLFGWKIKRVDLLSDLRIKSPSAAMDSLQAALSDSKETRVDSAAVRDSMIRATGMDSTMLALRDSLYKAVGASQGADSTGIRIEDYSVGHIGLKRFYAALNNRKQLGRPVRIAFLGDSFIEGDIMVADFRSGLQKLFGGRGVGFVPITSVSAQFRPTVEQHAEGWTTWSMLTDRTHPYILSGMLFEAKGSQASVSLKNTKRYPELHTVSSLKFYYEQNAATQLQLVCNSQADTLRQALPPTTTVTHYEQQGSFTEAHFTFTNTEGFRALGIAMEDNSGVVVDNFSLRGNSGLILARIDSTHCRALNAQRPYDLIVLQYGLNVVNEDMLQYGWYKERMIKVIHHLQLCFPGADILMMGVSDRSHQADGEFETMPAIFALLHAQRQAARQAGVPFWNVFGAMGGENSMVRFVENNWASKDYTHLSFRGGREIAAALLKAILSEKQFYDEAQKATY